jgi:hypothetical protein
MVNIHGTLSGDDGKEYEITIATVAPNNGNSGGNNGNGNGNVIAEYSDPSPWSWKYSEVLGVTASADQWAEADFSGCLTSEQTIGFELCGVEAVRGMGVLVSVDYSRIHVEYVGRSGPITYQRPSNSSTGHFRAEITNNVLTVIIDGVVVLNLTFTMPTTRAVRCLTWHDSSSTPKLTEISFGSLDESQPIPPAAPTLSGAAGDGTVSLSWNHTGTKYYVYQDNTLIAESVEESYVVEGLTNDRNYEFFVVAENSVGSSSDSNRVTLTPHEAPGGGISSTLPQWVIAAYWQMYNGPSVSTITTNAPDYNVQLAAFGFGNGGASITFNPAFQSGESLRNDIAESKASGCRWLLSLGGGVPASEQVFLRSEAEATTAFNTLIPIIDTYGFDGIDYDLENGPSGFTLASMLSLSQKLKNRYGDGFIISMVPRPYEDFFFQIAAAHENAGILDLCMFQFYDWYQTEDTSFLSSWIPSRLDAAHGYGVPYNKMIVGCCTYYPEYGGGANTVQNYATIIQNMKTSRGIRGAFIWESYLDSLKGYTFGPAMAAIA